MVLFLAGVLTLSPCYGDINILTNPGFEDSNGWAARGCTFTYTTAQKHSGTYSGKASKRTATWQGIKQSLLGKVQDGNTYAISGWVKLENSDSNIVKVSVEQTDSNGGTRYYTINSKTANKSSWIQLSGSFTLDVNGILGTLDVYFEGPAADVNFFVDDANVFGPPPTPTDPNATGQINTSIRHQVLEGFGAAGAWYEGTLVSLGQSDPNIYKVLFGQLGLDIYRLRNAYGQSGGSSYIDNSATIVARAASSLGHPIKIMISSWSPPNSPPYSLKSNNSTVGGTLAKDFNDPNNGSSGYVYQRFAQWWYNSIIDFNNHGIRAEYINMQNEPDYLATWDSCRFDPNENSSYAGYNSAFQALSTKVAALPNPPKLLAPETAGFNQLTSYIDALFDRSPVYGYAHHLYNGGGDGDNPDGYISTMASFAAQYGYKPLLQTEYSHNESNFTDAINLAKLMHNSLTVEEVAAYMHWDLFWGTSGTGLVSITASSYTINPVYYAFKHYAAFTDPNWQRIEASTNSPALRISAYISPDNNQMSIVIINTSTDTNIALDFNSLGNFEVQDGNVYRTNSSLTQKCAFVGVFDANTPLTLPKNSITTVALMGTLIPTNCQEVQDFHYRLLADLNSDCYINFKDLLVMTEHWLETSPITVFPPEHSPDIHTDSDNIVNLLDFADLAAQWLTCNDPGGPGCISNWEN